MCVSPHRCGEQVPAPSDMESVCAEAERLTNGARRDSYGHPLDDYTRTAALFNAAFAHKLREPIQPEDMMLAMILVKVSRQVNMPKRDNLTDIAGYANCIDMALGERKRREGHTPDATDNG